LKSQRAPASERPRYRQNALHAIEQLRQPDLVRQLPDA
jgi:hypothetical protein